MATLNVQNGGRVLHLKGAFERVLPMCSNELGYAGGRQIFSDILIDRRLGMDCI
jgi:hypothetical protein